MNSAETLSQHWDAAYVHGDTTRSWYEAEPVMSLRMLDAARITAADAVIDIGGGASTLADALLERGFIDVSVLDISQIALNQAQQRLGGAASRIDWIHADLLTWQSPRRYRAWHDRAVFHFLTSSADRRRYLARLTEATSPDSVAVFGCFAPDGPEYCSGLPVARHSAGELADVLGDGWRPISDDRQVHITPAGVAQPFTWAVFSRH
jgi:trans-aconitate methyltransferase